MQWAVFMPVPLLEGRENAWDWLGKDIRCWFPSELAKVWRNGNLGKQQEVGITIESFEDCEIALDITTGQPGQAASSCAGLGLSSPVLVIVSLFFLGSSAKLVADTWASSSVFV